MVAMKEIVAVGEEIGRIFKPKRVILFGSHANGRATRDSDVDLLVVMPHVGEGYKTATRIRERIEISFPVDILVRSPSELRERVRRNDFFIQEILDHGKVIYEAGNGRMGAKGRRGLRQHASRLSRAKVA